MANALRAKLVTLVVAKASAAGWAGTKPAAAAAAAAAAATTKAAATKAAATAATAATATLRFADAEVAASDGTPVGALDRLGRVGGRLILDKGKAADLARLAVEGDVHVPHGSKFGKDRTQRSLRGLGRAEVACEVADKEARSLLGRWAAPAATSSSASSTSPSSSAGRTHVDVTAGHVAAIGALHRPLSLFRRRELHKRKTANFARVTVDRHVNVQHRAELLEDRAQDIARGVGTSQVACEVSDEKTRSVLWAVAPAASVVASSSSSYSSSYSYSATTFRPALAPAPPSRGGIAPIIVTALVPGRAAPPLPPCSFSRHWCKLPGFSFCSPPRFLLWR